MSAPLVIPSIVFGVALLIILLRFLGVELSLWTVGASHVFICIPFAMTVLMSRLEGFDKSLEEASRDLGEGAWMTFVRVTLPLAMSGIISSLLLCFITSFDEFVLAFFLSGTQPTLPVYLFGQLRFPNKLPGMLALGSSILFVSALLVILAELLRRRGVPSNAPGDA
jgi:spermidine/putrescine transport system permease protein